ncbi:hypothetical protein JTE90_000265 [Oedothorax gibbosus]|uniref:Uncharacterized protein n=1 Tax=Oedothorax gibbosus TaxID=931172 RepID=A0AAV6VUE7_9ARAC|nr:hypothetical protein JTE90_000265 [Oedothorax gibbosus]
MQKSESREEVNLNKGNGLGTKCEAYLRRKHRPFARHTRNWAELSKGSITQHDSKLQRSGVETIEELGHRENGTEPQADSPECSIMVKHLDTTTDFKGEIELKFVLSLLE